MGVTFEMLDVKQGECIIVDFPDQTFGVFDGGPTLAAAGILPSIQARKKGGHHCRFVSASQWDRDHIAGLPVIIEEARPDMFVTPSVALDVLENIARRLDNKPVDKLFGAIRESVERAGSESVQVGRGQAIPLDDLPDVKTRVLGPPLTLLRSMESRFHDGDVDDLREFRNAASMAVWIGFRGRAALLTGEQPETAWLDMEDFCRRLSPSMGLPFDPRADWIKLSHHGAANENDGRLFQYFARSRFVGSASSSGTRYGHPHPRALATLRSVGGAAMCTRLGQGCKAIHTHGHDPMMPAGWAAGVAKFPPGGTPCHGTITVSIDDTGVVTVSGVTQQPLCPYGAPQSGIEAW